MNSSKTARNLALGAIFTAAVMSTSGCSHIARQLYMGVPAATASSRDESRTPAQFTAEKPPVLLVRANN